MFSDYGTLPIRDIRVSYCRRCIVAQRVVFRILQADLGNLESIAILGIIHGAAEVIERSTMVVIDHICHLIWKGRSIIGEVFILLAMRD